MKNLLGGLIGLLVLVSSNAQASINDLFISEYVEGKGYNKAIELFNGNRYPSALPSLQFRKRESKAFIKSTVFCIR